MGHKKPTKRGNDMILRFDGLDEDPIENKKMSFAHFTFDVVKD